MNYKIINMDISEESQSNIEYIHFKTRFKINGFIELLKVNGISITGTCCRGFGCGIKKYEFETANQLYLKFNSNNFDECIVCYENTNIITPCRHHLCTLCSDKLNKKICPYCRVNL